MYPTAIQVIPNDDFTLTIKYQNGETRFYDMTPLLNHGVFAEMQDLNYFRLAFIDEQFGAVCWPNEQDICPNTLYEQSFSVSNIPRNFKTEMAYT